MNYLKNISCQISSLNRVIKLKVKGDVDVGQFHVINFFFDVNSKLDSIGLLKRVQYGFKEFLMTDVLHIFLLFKLHFKFLV